MEKRDARRGKNVRCATPHSTPEPPSRARGTCEEYRLMADGGPESGPQLATSVGKPRRCLLEVKTTGALYS